MSPYRISALVPSPPSLWERFWAYLEGEWARFHGEDCQKRNGHRWRVTRYWNLSDHPEINVYLNSLTHGLGHDGVCTDCGAELRSFEVTANLLKEIRYVKRVDTGKSEGRHRAEALNQLAERTLKGISLRNDSWTYPRLILKGPSVEECDPEEIFSWKYLE